MVEHHRRGTSVWRYDDQGNWEESWGGYALDWPCTTGDTGTLEDAMRWSDQESRWPRLCQDCVKRLGLKW